MISVVHDSGNIRRFRSNAQATKWLAENAGNDRSEYTVLTDQVHPAGIFLSSVLHLKECKSCKAVLRVELEEDEYGVLACPGCGCRTVVE